MQSGTILKSVHSQYHCLHLESSHHRVFHHCTTLYCNKNIIGHYRSLFHLHHNFFILLDCQHNCHALGVSFDRNLNTCLFIPWCRSLGRIIFKSHGVLLGGSYCNNIITMFTLNNND